MTVQSASLSDRGRRKNNEDFVAFFEPTDPAELKQSGCLYIVADGVGGAAQGERASQFAAQKILYEYYQSSVPDPRERLQQIIKRVNDDIYSYASQNHTRMATTLVTVVLRDGYLYAANVGDSRAYLIRDTNVIQVTRDHSIVGEMVGMGEMTEEEAMASKIKNRLTRSLGGDEEVSVDVYQPLALKTGDKILLCSDGLTRYALRDDLARITGKSNDPTETAREMVEFANSKGGADNISVILVSFIGESHLEPTIRIERPRRVDWDTLMTQPGESIRSYRKRRTARTTSWLVLFISTIIAIALIGWLGGDFIGQMLFATAQSPAQPTQANLASLTPHTNPTQLPTLAFSPTAPLLFTATVPPPTDAPIPTVAKTVAPDKKYLIDNLIAKNSCGVIFVFKIAGPADLNLENDFVITPDIQLFRVT